MNAPFVLVTNVWFSLPRLRENGFPQGMPHPWRWLPSKAFWEGWREKIKHWRQVVGRGKEWGQGAAKVTCQHPESEGHKRERRKLRVSSLNPRRASSALSNLGFKEKDRTVCSPWCCFFMCQICITKPCQNISSSVLITLKEQWKKKKMKRSHCKTWQAPEEILLRHLISQIST